MPLINVNKNNQSDNVANNQSITPQNSQNNLQTNTVGENMPLQGSVPMTVNENGVKEYGNIQNTPQLQVNVDPSDNLEQKIQNVTLQAQPEIPQQQNQAIQASPIPNFAGNNEAQAQQANQQQTESNLVNSGTMSYQEIVERAISEEASDIHLTVGYRPMIRVDGNLKTLNAREVTPEEMLQYCSVITEKRSDIVLDKITQADLSYTYKDRRFRVNIFRMMGNLSVVARLIPQRIKTIDELALPQITKELCKVPAGLVLLTGPTGSGKSTTLAAMLNHINNSRAEHIVTLEDPIEFVYPKGQSLIDQRELGQDFESWTSALRSILRQDPNVVLVGEMRDYETISSTITVAETGHLVFATLHTNSAAQTIDRIIDVFPENQQDQVRTQLAQVITAIVAQRLVPLPGGGRKAVHEILVATPAVKNAVREGQTHQIDNMIQTGQDYGMITMEKSLVEMIRKGEISIDTAKEVSIKPDELDILLSQV